MMAQRLEQVFGGNFDHLRVYSRSYVQQWLIVVGQLSKRSIDRQRAGTFNLPKTGAVHHADDL